MSNLINKEIKNKEICKFDFDIVYEDRELNEQKLRVNFTKIYNQVTINEWKIFCKIEPTQEKETQIYEFNYQLHKKNTDLTLIVATGIRLLQVIIQEEIQEKSRIDTNITEMLIKGNWLDLAYN